jgi:hypothetical protein
MPTYLEQRCQQTLEQPPNELLYQLLPLPSIPDGNPSALDTVVRLEPCAVGHTKALEDVVEGEGLEPAEGNELVDIWRSDG